MQADAGPNLRNTEFPTYKVDNGPLHHIAAARKGPLFLTGGPQSLVTVELLSSLRDGGDCPQFFFEKRRSLSYGGAGVSRARLGQPSCTGISFLPGSDKIAASCTGNGRMFLWDTNALQTNPLLRTWHAHGRNVTSIEFLATGSSGSSCNNSPAALVSADGGGSCFLWRIDSELWEGKHGEDEEDAHWSRQQAPKQDASNDWSGITKEDLRLTKHSSEHVLDMHSQFVNGAQLLLAQENGRATLLNIDQLGSVMHFHVSHKPLLSTRFHPQFPSIFAAAEQEKVVRILDTRLASTSNKACVCLLRVAAAVGCIRWRPEVPMQLASSGWLHEFGGSGSGGGLAIWDLRKVFVPMHRFNMHGDLLPDFFWADTNHIVSCGKDSTVQLHSVTSSVQPLRSTCFSAVSWSVRKGSSAECLAAVAEKIDREAESSSSTPIEICCELSAAVHHRGFDSDVGLPKPKDFEDLVVELQPTQESTRYCGFFSTDFNGETDDEQKLRELMCLAPFRPKDAGVSAVDRCAHEVERCLSMGFVARAHIWRLLAKVVGCDVPSYVLLTNALNGSGVPDGASSQRRTSARGAGAKFTADVEGGIDYASLSPRSSFGHSERMKFHMDSLSESSECAHEEQVNTILGNWQRMWRTQTLRHVIEFHEEHNDVGMLLALVAAFGVGDDPDSKIKKRIFRWTQGAADILTRHQAFVPRAALFRSIPFLDVQQLGRRNTLLSLRCGQPRCPQPFEPTRGLCARAIPMRGVDSRRKSKASTSSGECYPVCQSFATCPKCNRNRTPPCTICGERVRGLWTACQVCGHGGHLHHMREWFSNGERRCPAGCGHQCAPPG